MEVEVVSMTVVREAGRTFLISKGGAIVCELSEVGECDAGLAVKAVTDRLKQERQAEEMREEKELMKLWGDCLRCICSSLSSNLIAWRDADPWTTRIANAASGIKQTVRRGRRSGIGCYGRDEQGRNERTWDYVVRSGQVCNTGRFVSRQWQRFCDNTASNLRKRFWLAPADIHTSPANRVDAQVGSPPEDA